MSAPTVLKVVLTSLSDEIAMYRSDSNNADEACAVSIPVDAWVFADRPTMITVVLGDFTPMPPWGDVTSGA